MRPDLRSDTEDKAASMKNSPRDFLNHMESFTTAHVKPLLIALGLRDQLRSPSVGSASAQSDQRPGIWCYQGLVRASYRETFAKVTNP